MPYTPAHKQESRDKILASAFELFTRRGYDCVSIDELMAHAGLTRGAFYAHFDSKSELYGEAILAAASNSLAAQLFTRAPDNVLEQLIEGYLSPGHVQHKHHACGLAFLVTDVASRDIEVRNSYSKVFESLARAISKHLPGDDARQRALAMTVLMVGGVAVGRALSDPALVEQLLAACREAAQALSRAPATPEVNTL